MTTTFFHDVSRIGQGLDYHPDGPVIAKATQGTAFIDAAFATNRARTLANGWPFLAYHFLEHGNVRAQVEHALSVIGRGLPVMIDMEWVVYNGVRQPDPTMDDFYEFVDLWPALGGSLVSLGYIPRAYWREIGSPASLADLPAHDIGLISSYYTTYSDAGPGWAPYAPGMPAPIVWQYTSTPVDSNAFKGTVVELRSLFEEGIAMADTANTTRAGLFADGLLRDAATIGTPDSPYPDHDGVMSMATFWEAVERHAAAAVKPQLDAILAAIAAIAPGQLVDHTHDVGAGGQVSVSGATGPALPVPPPAPTS